MTSFKAYAGFLACLTVSFLNGVSFADDRQLVNREASRTTLRSLLAATRAIESYAIDHNFWPRIEGPADAAEHLTIYLYGESLVDGWGTSLSIESSTNGYKIVSAGADLELSATHGTGPRQRWEDDIVVKDGELTQWHSRAIAHYRVYPRECQETEQSMTIIAASLELYRAVYGDYPTSQFIDELAVTLSPSFAGDLPQQDAWGGVFSLRSTPRSWSIVSNGNDGTADSSRSDERRLLPRDDIVLTSRSGDFSLTCDHDRHY